MNPISGSIGILVTELLLMDPYGRIFCPISSDSLTESDEIRSNPALRIREQFCDPNVDQILQDTIGFCQIPMVPMGSVLDPIGFGVGLIYVGK
jgi:hypothetical protein